MSDTITLRVPATLTAISTVRLVLGGLGARLDLSLDQLQDIYLAMEELLRAAIDFEAPERLSVEVAVARDDLRITAGEFVSAQLREDVACHAEDRLDLCMLLHNTVDDVLIEDVPGAYRIVLVKRLRGAAS